MASGSLSRIRLYAPFLALVALQALLVALLPSTSGGGDPAGGFAGGQASAEQGGLADDGAGADPSGAAGGAGPGELAEADPDAAGTGTSGGGGAAAAPEGTEAPDDAGDGQGAGSGDAAVASGGGTDHCADDGRQTDVVTHVPECVPVFEGDNGGATYPGVTEDSITVVWFTTETNEQVEAIGASAGAASEEDSRWHLQMVIDWINDTYELYGREIDLAIFQADCPQTPPDVPACRAEARRMLEEHDPFAVMWATPLYPQIFDEFAREGVLSLGGMGFAEQFYTARRPYRWDLTMDGTKAGEFVAEYYCKKLAGDNASHAGEVIHPTIGTRDTTQRKMGIITPETEANIAAANRVRELVADCDGQDVPLATYESDIERAQEQSTARTAKMINENVTTVVCMCDPISPIFTTTAFTSQQYYPEHLVAGMIGMDFDQVGRLYDPGQWQHAFGISHISQPPPEEESAGHRIHRAAEAEGEPRCQCSTQTHYSLLLGRMFQNAGPDLTPHTIEQGMLEAPIRGGWENTGGDPEQQLHRFGPDDYTANSDVREVYWDGSAVSENDGEPGAYVPMNDGRRYTLGEFTTEFEIPQP